MSLMVISKKVLLGNEIIPAAIVISGDGGISEIHTSLPFPVNQYDVLDVGESVVLPGVVDSHVHLNEPGRDHWEGFLTGTKAAASGGITTLVDMPLNSIPPTTTVENLNKKLDATKGQLFVDVGFWGGVVPSNLGDLRDLIDVGVVGFKGFLCPSGVDEFPHISAKEIEKAMQILEGTGAVLAFHAELENEKQCQTFTDPANYSTFLDSRPPSMEIQAVKLITDLCLKHRKTRCHIVHASASSVVEAVAAAREKGAKLTVETCHHYLNLSAQQIPRASSQFKCCPPIREKENQEELWCHVAQGDIDLVVSDHSPSPPNLKCDNFLTSWGGISSLQFGLSLMWTQASRRGFDLAFVSHLLSEGPAKLCRLERKGSIAVGKDADLVIFDPDHFFTLTEDIIQHKHKLSPYLGTTIRGKVLQTILRGKIIYQADQPLGQPQGLPILLKNIKKTE